MKISACLVVLMLAGCTAAPPAPGPEACDIRKAAEIPLTVTRGVVGAPASIEDKPVTLLLDTGSESSLVTPSAVAELRLSEDRHRRTTILGTGGTVVSQNVLLQSLALGGMEVLDQSVAVGRLPAGEDAAMAASGLIGADWLRDFDVELDLPHRRMALYHVASCGDDYVPWPGAKTSVIAQIYRGNLVVLSATLDGQRVSAFLDSGANRSVLGEAAAARIGVDMAALATDRGGASTGIDGEIRRMHRHRFGELQIGNARYAGPLLDIAPLRVTAADMLLGADWLQGNKVWISYALRRVTFQPAAPAP